MVATQDAGTPQITNRQVIIPGAVRTLPFSPNSRSHTSSLGQDGVSNAPVVQDVENSRRSLLNVLPPPPPPTIASGDDSTIMDDCCQVLSDSDGEATDPYNP